MTIELQQAAEAALRVFEESGLAGHTKRGITYLDGAYSFRWYTEFPTTNGGKVVASIIVCEKAVYGGLDSEPDGGIVGGGAERAPTIDGAVQAATKLVNLLKDGPRKREP